MDEFSEGVMDNDNLMQFNSSITHYFDRDPDTENFDSLLNQKWGFRDPDLIAKQKEDSVNINIAIKLFVKANYPELQSGRTVAKIFHGISSAKYPAYEWSRNEYWAKMGHVNFKRLAKLADMALVLFNLLFRWIINQRMALKDVEMKNNQINVIIF
jgi:hypothetical protein